MPSGGKREGAGRPPIRGTTGINKTIRFTPEEWKQVVGWSKLLNLNPSEYIRRKALE